MDEVIRYRVYVSAPNKPREMFRYKTSSEDDLIREINERYPIVYECTVSYYDKKSNLITIRFNIVDGHVVK